LSVSDLGMGMGRNAAPSVLMGAPSWEDWVSTRLARPGAQFLRKKFAGAVAKEA
jgi:hypothetical protein